jgi:GTP-binding nuclear protein Ran
MTYNINILGDGGVGKSVWIHKMRSNTFVNKYVATVGYEVYPTSINTNHGYILVNFYDYAGQEKYIPQNTVYHTSNATILMFDLTRNFTYKNLNLWKEKCKEEHVFIVGNKSDCDDITIVPNIPYLSVSAKTMTLTDLLTPILQKLTGHQDLAIIV